jgi:hypothetical protein
MSQAMTIYTDRKESLNSDGQRFHQINNANKDLSLEIFEYEKAHDISQWTSVSWPGT